MNHLITECNELLKGNGFKYAFCGGFALELFLGKEIGPHSDLDVFFLENDKKTVIAFIQQHADRAGYQLDFDLTVPLLSNESKDWLVNAIDVSYPMGHKWLDLLKAQKFEGNDEYAAAHAKKVFCDNPLLNFQVADGNKFSFEASCFDLIYFFDMVRFDILGGCVMNCKIAISGI